jgi:hypothetical protein
MTVMIDRFFGIPPGIIRLGKVKSLSGAACDRVHKLEQIVDQPRAAEAAEFVLRP